MRALVLAALAAAGLLVGCAGPNRLQFSGETDPFPSDYREVATKAIERRATAGQQVQVSYPQTTVGTNAFAPKRWYVCVRDLSTWRQPPTPTLLDRVGNLVDPGENLYEVVLILRPGASPTLLHAFDAGLCRDARFEPLTLPE